MFATRLSASSFNVAITAAPVVSGVVGVLVISYAFIPLFPFRRELIAVGLAIWMVLGTVALGLFVAFQLYIAAFMRGCTISYC